MFPGCQKALENETLKVLEHVRIAAAHNLHKVVKQLEGCRFEAHVASRRVGQEEAKVNVQNVALIVDHNVAIVSGED